MATARDFQSILIEYLACSRRQGKAYERQLGIRKNGSGTLYGVGAPLLSVAEILAVEPQEFRRKFRGEIGVLSNVDQSCPHCGHRFVYDCPHCGRLSCCGDVVRNKCTWCGVVGTAEIQPERPERRTPGDVVWTAWIAFNEWVYDLMTRRNRPKTMREAEETFRTLKKP
ncbi:MAG: hypothetical protein ACRD8O_14915 [Bryobacteraceae bacterium]